MTKTPQHPPRDPTTGQYLGSLAASVTLDGPQRQKIRKLLADSPLTPSQIQAQLGNDNPSIALNPHLGESIRKYLALMVEGGEVTMVTTQNRKGRHVFTGSYQLSPKGCDLLQKGL